MSIRERKNVRTRIVKITTAITNPDCDRRCRHGHKSVPNYPAGAAFRATDWEQDYEIVPGEWKTVSGTDYRDADRSGWFSDELNALIAKQDSGVESKPETLEDIAAAENVSVSFICENAVRSLLASGKLTIDDVINAYEVAG